MGMYLYRITAERIKLNDGTEANVAKYAYKPMSGMFTGIRETDAHNAKLHFRTGCYASERMAREKKLTDKIVYSGRVYRNERNLATFLDDAFVDNNEPIRGVYPVKLAGWIKKVRRYANDHYEEDGWDIVVEAYSDEDLVGLMADHETYEEAFETVKKIVGIHDERRDDARLEAERGM